ncbi:MAG: hypothetical protein ACR2PY_01405, partial [Salinispira sp.]
ESGMGAGMLCVDTLYTPRNNAQREAFVEVGVYEVPEYLSIPESIFPALVVYHTNMIVSHTT